MVECGECTYPYGFIWCCVLTDTRPEQPILLHTQQGGCYCVLYSLWYLRGDSLVPMLVCLRPLRIFGTARARALPQTHDDTQDSPLLYRRYKAKYTIPLGVGATFTTRKYFHFSPTVREIKSAPQSASPSKFGPHETPTTSGHG